MDPQVQALGIKLAEVTVRNTAGMITDRIATVKARKKNEETIAELEEIISGLLADKSELVRIAKAYEEDIVAQRISQDEIEYISTNIVPLIERLTESTSAQGQEEDATAAQQMIDVIKPLVSIETVTILQLVGFNFRRAIGEPLTELISRLILSNTQPDPALDGELQRLSIKYQEAIVGMAQDPEAYRRFREISGEEARE